MHDLNEVGIITQARCSSTRLPGKILIPVGAKTVLQHHVDRLKESGLKVYVATSLNEDDNEVAVQCTKFNVPFHRGPLYDVLARFYGCAQQYGIKTIVRVTSDCPLIDGEIIRAAVEEFLLTGDKNLYYSNVLERTFPRGFDFEIFSFEALEDAYLNGKEEVYREHVTPYINRNISGKIVFKHLTRQHDASKFRITLDTPDDLILIKKLIEEYSCDKMNADEIIALLEKHPELHAINAHIEQKKL
jgi:spore coat polysaccharide biosynthesis protein SpsF